MYVPIELHLELDEYKPDLLLPSETQSGSYEVIRRLPAGTHRYYFTVGGIVKVAKDHRVILNDNEA